MNYELFKDQLTSKEIAELKEFDRRYFTLMRQVRTGKIWEEEIPYSPFFRKTWDKFLRAERNCFPISVRWPHFDRLDGKSQPSRLSSTRARRSSQTRSLIGIILLPSVVLLSGTKMTRFFQLRFSMRI